MTQAKSYFFCGIGGSGMLPLASIVRARGFDVEGSDRALDQGRVADKFAFLERQGIRCTPGRQRDAERRPAAGHLGGRGRKRCPDVPGGAAAGREHLTRPQLLARLFNAAPTGIAVGGTSASPPSPA
jgi:UDP-N-acetylmuramate--alanine ligase